MSARTRYNSDHVMNNTNHVCWKCRTCNRHGGACSDCGKPTQKLLDKWCVPPKNKKKEWEELKEFAISFNTWHNNNYLIWLEEQCK